MSILLFGVVGSYVLEHLIAKFPNQLGFLAFFPFRAFGDACMVALIVGVTFDWIVRKESEKRLHEVLRRTLHTQSKDFAANVSKSLLIDKEVIRRVLRPEEIERLIRMGLQIQVHDDQLGADLYDGLLRRAYGYDERWYNYQYKASLASIADESVSAEIRDKYFQAYIDLRYETKLNKTSFVFTCASTIEEYNALLKDPRFQETWHLPLTQEIPRIDETAFEVRSMNVGGIDLNIRRESTDGTTCHIVCDHPSLKEKLDSWVVVNYRYETKVRKRGHLFRINLVVPTKGINMELDFARTDIHYMNVLDFFVSAENPTVRYIPSRQRPHRIEVELSEWGFPKGGVAFVWVLEQEFSNQRSRRTSAKKLK
jgi:hypothetical protein